MKKTGIPTQHILASIFAKDLRKITAAVEGGADIAQRDDEGVPLIHHVAECPAVLTYLLSKGADINARDKEYGRTPILKMFSHVTHLEIESADVDALLSIYERHKADIHAVDKRKQGLAEALLFIPYGHFNPVQKKCITWALKKGVNFLTRDKNGDIPIDRLLREDPNNRRLEAEVLDSFFADLARYGYDILAQMRKYAHRYIISEIAPSFYTQREKICAQLAKADLPAHLWNPKDHTPSKLLLCAFGYGVPDKIFEHPSLKDKPVAKQALYKKMEEKLPSQCQDFLRNGFDKTFLRDVKRPERSPTIDAALRRAHPSDQKPDAREGRT